MKLKTKDSYHLEVRLAGVSSRCFPVRHSKPLRRRRRARAMVGRRPGPSTVSSRPVMTPMSPRTTQWYAAAANCAVRGRGGGGVHPRASAGRRAQDVGCGTLGLRTAGSGSGRRTRRDGTHQRHRLRNTAIHVENIKGRATCISSL